MSVKTKVREQLDLQAGRGGRKLGQHIQQPRGAWQRLWSVTDK